MNHASWPESAVLLARLEEGDAEARSQVLPRLYDELHRIASALMQSERDDHTLQPTALIHEAWVRLAGSDAELVWQGQRQFLGLAAQTMRRVLVDHARARGAAKRGVGVQVEGMEEWVSAFDSGAVDVLALHDALEELGELDAELVRLVELRFFAGLSMPEVAQALSCSLSTAERSWRTARAWLQKRLRD